MTSDRRDHRLNATVLPDPLGTAMQAAMPVIFIVTVEAARHAVGILGGISDTRHINGIRPARWPLSSVPNLQTLARHAAVEPVLPISLKAEQDRLLYLAKLNQRHGIGWRSRATVEELLPLRLAALGVPKPKNVTLRPRAATPPAAQPLITPSARASAPPRPGQRVPARHPDTEVASAEPTPTTARLTREARQPSAREENRSRSRTEEAGLRRPSPLR